MEIVLSSLQTQVITTVGNGGRHDTIRIVGIGSAFPFERCTQHSPNEKLALQYDQITLRRMNVNVLNGIC